MNPDTIALDRRHVWHPFTQSKTAPDPVVITRGEGAYLIAEDGARYLDLISSWWVNIHGHACPEIASAISDQAYRLEQVAFAGLTHRPGVELASRLAGLLPGDLDRVFFSDNGSTAVEIALKIAWQYWHNRGDKQRCLFAAFGGGYHGDTLGAMSVGFSSGFYAPFADMVRETAFVPFADTWMGDNSMGHKEAEALHAVETLLSEKAGQLAAVILEPLIQAAGGMRMGRPEFLRDVVARFQKAGVIVIFDEVMTGFGRTGAMFGCDKAAVVPDIMCVAKSLTGGFLPLAATICREEIHQSFLSGSFDTALAHGHSFTANPLGCAAALASLDLLEKGNCLEKIAEIERIHQVRLGDLAACPTMTHPRVMGSVAAFDLHGGDKGYGAQVGRRLSQRMRKRGFILRPLGEVVYLMPPYCIDANALHSAYDALAAELPILLN